LERVRPHRQPELTLVLDVVVMSMCPEDERRLDAPALDGLTQGSERSARVDVYGRPAHLVRDEVGVRQPVGMHAPSDEHTDTLPGTCDEEERNGGIDFPDDD